jgi:hypothetical protein
MPVMTSRLVLSLKAVADQTGDVNERSLTVMSFSARFSTQGLGLDLDAPTYVDERVLPLRARRGLINPDQEVR